MLCRKAIVILVEIGLEKQKESELIEAIRKQFKKELSASIGVRQLTTDAVAKAKHVVDRLTHKLSRMIRDDVYHLSQLYEVIHDRMQVAAKELGGFLTGAAGVQGNKGQDSIELFQRIGEVLVSLITDYPRELKPYKSAVDTTTNALVLEKRREMVDHLLEQVGIERRRKSDRRTTPDRRKRQDPDYRGSERRVLRDRRTRAGRRGS